MRSRLLLPIALTLIMSGCASLSSLSIRDAAELENRTSLQVSEGNSVTLLPTGEQFYSSLLQDISTAREYVFMEYYTIENDSAGRTLMEGLAECTGRGVKVYVLYDSYGSTKVSHPLTGDMVDKYAVRGIEIEAFNPVVNSLPRDHRKLTVIDGRTAYVGGMNITESNLECSESAYLTRDLTLRLEGPVAGNLVGCFERTWYSISSTPLPSRESRTMSSTETDCGHISRNSESGRVFDNVSIAVADTYGKRTSLTPENIFENLIRASESEIRIVNAYFMPTKVIRKALEDAAGRGVRISILIGEKTDLPSSLKQQPHNIAKRLSRRQGISLHIIPGSFYHAKAMTVDGRTMFTGSCNLDFLSLRSNLEISLIIKDSSLVKELDTLFDAQL